MAEKLDFEKISDEIASMEKSLIPFKKYSGKIFMKLGVKISPSEYSYLTYQDLLNFYERMAKIKRTSELVKSVSPKEAKEVEEAETAIKEISKEASALTLPEKKKEEEPVFEKEEFPAPEIGPPVFEKPTEEKKPEIPDVPDVDISFEETAEKPEPEPELKKAEEEVRIPLKIKPKKVKKKEKIEFEVPVPDLEEEEKPRAKEISPVVFESALSEKKRLEEKRIIAEKELEEKPLEMEEEPRHAGEMEYLSSHEHPHLAQFPSIEQDPETVALSKYKEISTKLEASPGTLSKTYIKTQMLALTKQLFREKLTSEREKIKKEIIRLKNLLTSKTTIKKMSYKTILETLPDEFNSEVLEYATALENIAVHSLSDAKNEFYTTLEELPSDDNASRKKTFELFSSDLSSLEEQAASLCEKSSDFLLKTHISVLNQIKQNSSAVEIKMCNDILSKMTNEYKIKFSRTLTYLKEYMEIIRAKAANDSGVMADKNLKPLFESAELSDEQLLHYLQANHPKKYGLYLKKQLSKLEALSHARNMFAKEKGLSNELLSKYFKER